MAPAHSFSKVSATLRPVTAGGQLDLGPMSQSLDLRAVSREGRTGAEQRGQGDKGTRGQGEGVTGAALPAEAKQAGIAIGIE